MGRIVEMMESLASESPTSWIENRKIQDAVLTDGVISRLVDSPMVRIDATEMVNFVSRGYSMIDGLREATAKGLPEKEIVESREIGYYNFNEATIPILFRIYNSFERSPTRPFAYKLRSTQGEG